jgi:ABC-type polysaccharide/polyol phosphate export permease
MAEHQAQQAAPSIRTILADGLDDLVGGFLAWPIWTRLGWNDIRQRYRRSVLGPFWITLSTAIFISFLGLIYSRLFGIDVATYLPYLAIGYIIWIFISSTTTECCSAFHENQAIILQRRLPFSIYIFKNLWRNNIVLAHNIILVVAIYLIFKINPGASILLALPGFFILCLNQLWLGIVLAIMNTRFRDVVQIVTSVVQITLFATPILWPVSRIGNARIIADINPVYHFIQLIRAPLLGQQPDVLSWMVALSTVSLGTLCAIWLISRTSKRIVYWL